MISKKWRWKMIGLDFAPAQTEKLSYTLIAMVMFLLLLFASFRVYHFSLWEQVEYFGGSNLGPWHLVERMHPHALRYLLVWPVYFLERSFEIDRKIFYNLLTSFVLLYVPLVIYFSLSKLGVEKKRGHLVFIVCLIMYAILGLFMNGRIIWAHAGIMMAITAPLFYRESFLSASLLFIHLTAALLMASVSSGTLVVAYASSAVMACIYLKRSRDQRKMLYFRIVPLLIVLLMFLPWVVTGLFKNINFYGGGIDGVVNMADHGALSAVVKTPSVQSGKAPAVGQDNEEAGVERYKKAIFFLSLLPMLALVLLIQYSRRCHLELRLSLAWVALIFVTLIGQFGYSTLTLAIPLVMLLIGIDPFRQSHIHNQ